jgi:hypothetical protein
MDANWVIAGLTLSLVVITGIYAYLTWRLAKSAERTIEESQRGALFVTLKFRQGGPIAQLHIGNMGRSTAEKCTFSLSTEVFDVSESEKLNDKPFFSGGACSLPPGASVEFALPVAPAYFSKMGSQGYPPNFRVNYEYSSLGKKYKETSSIDVALYARSSRIIEQSEEFYFSFPQMMKREIGTISKSLAKNKHMKQKYLHI